MAQQKNGIIDPLNLLGGAVASSTVLAIHTDAMARAPELAGALWFLGLLGGALFISFHCGVFGQPSRLVRALLIAGGAIAIISAVIVANLAPSAVDATTNNSTAAPDQREAPRGASKKQTTDPAFIKL